MKQSVVKLTFLLFAVCFFTAAKAYDFEVDGVCYDFISAADRTCQVVGNVTDNGEITIPATVVNNGSKLKVVRVNSFGHAHSISITSGEDALYLACKFPSELDSLYIDRDLDWTGNDIFNSPRSLTSLTIGGNVMKLPYKFIHKNSLNENVCAQNPLYS